MFVIDAALSLLRATQVAKPVDQGIGVNTAQEVVVRKRGEISFASRRRQKQYLLRRVRAVDANLAPNKQTRTTALIGVHMNPLSRPHAPKHSLRRRRGHFHVNVVAVVQRSRPFIEAEKCESSVR